MAIGDKLFIADKQTLDQASTNVSTVNTKLGTNTDTAGTTTIFARLNQIVTNLATMASTALSTATWTSTRAAKLDLVGVANPTTADESTIMNFLKKINNAVGSTSNTAYRLIKTVTAGTNIIGHRCVFGTDYAFMQSQTYLKFCDFNIRGISGTVRCRATVKTISSATTATVRIYKNGTYITNAQATTTSTSYVQLTIDVTVAHGDTISFYMNSSNANVVYMSLAEILYDWDGTMTTTSLGSTGLLVPQPFAIAGETTAISPKGVQMSVSPPGTYPVCVLPYNGTYQLTFFYNSSANNTMEILVNGVVNNVVNLVNANAQPAMTTVTISAQAGSTLALRPTPYGVTMYSAGAGYYVETGVAPITL